MSEIDFARLRAADTPTICNALEIARGARQNTGFTRKPMVAADPTLPSIVGHARCVRLRAANPPVISQAEVAANRMAYYEYITSGPGPTVVVIEDLDYPDCLGAFWGDLNVAVHKGLGIEGVITNGVLRDLNTLDPGFQVLAGSVLPSHAFVHIVEIDVPVTILGMEVKPGDIVHGDRHGAENIPLELAANIPDAIDKVFAREDIITAAARQPGFNLAKLKEAWAAADKVRPHWHKPA
jgi:regulator of RNase E activity RraA